MPARLYAGIACVVGFLAASIAAAQSPWPAKPITMIVPFATGGTADIVARTLAPKLGRELGQTLVVDNKGGAGGTIGTALLARAPADGYTIMVHHMGITFNASLYDRLPFDTLRDIAPVAYIGATPNVLVVTNSLPVQNIQEFFALARRYPGTINYGSGGVGSAGHLPLEVLQSMMGLKLVHVPYKGSGPAITDLISGQIQTMLLTVPAVMSYIQSSKLRPLATSGSRRTPALPNLPTLEEAGVSGFEYAPWYGVFAPAKTPSPIVQRLHASINKVLAEPDIRDRLAPQGLEVQALTREQFAEKVKGDTAKWGETIRGLGIKGAE